MKFFEKQKNFETRIKEIRNSDSDPKKIYTAYLLGVIDTYDKLLRRHEV